jgi:N6-L-threonylcarbamoyladenine synthase
MSHQRPLILGIETSCDDTACAVLDGAGRVLASRVSSQLAAHRPYGGVVPEIASREHLRNWPAVARTALDPLGLTLADFDLVAATRGPGLVGSLLVGLSLAKAIAYALGRPFYAIHHLEGHLVSPFLAAGVAAAEELPERFVALVASGGHTALYEWRQRAVATLAETRDDAIGEVFDKLGKRLGLLYPQGPEVDRLAEGGDPARTPLPVPRAEGEPYFSFSGLKSAAIRQLEQLQRQGVAWDPEAPAGEVLDLLAAFRAAAVAQLVDRLERRHRARPIPLLAVSGGVAANLLLRRELAAWAQQRRVPLRLVPQRYAGDNAAMIAFAALLRHRAGDPGDPLSAEAASRLPVLGPPEGRTAGAE